MEFPIDLGFSLVDRYIVTALGKIKKQFLSDWEVFKKIQFFFSLRILLESISHLPGERDMLIHHYDNETFSFPLRKKLGKADESIKSNGAAKNYSLSW